MASFDQHKDLAQVTITAVSGNASTSTSLQIDVVNRTILPDAPFDGTLVPPETVALRSNSELIRVSAVATDGKLTVVRAQYGSIAKAVAAGWQLIAGLSAAQLKAIQDEINNVRTDTTNAIDSMQSTIVDAQDDLNGKMVMIGGNKINYLSADVPEGVPDDWRDVGVVKSNAQGKLWFRKQQVAEVPATQPAVQTLPAQRLGLAFAGWKTAWAQNDTTNGTILGAQATVSSEQIANSLTMCVLQRDRDAYATVLTAAITKMRRDVSGSGQATATKLFASQWSNTSKTVTDWKANAGDNLQILGAMIRAWNLWGLATDRDLASAVAADIKSYLIGEDEGRAYLLADTDPQSKHASGGHNHFKIEIGKQSPVIFRMAKTFTGDTVFDRLLTGYYDSITKMVSDGLATTSGLAPRFMAYDDASHHAYPIVSGQNGWTSPAYTDFDRDAGQTLFHLFADYKLFTSGLALSALSSAVKTTLTNKWTSDGKIFVNYTHTAGNNSTEEDVRRYFQAMFALIANDTGNANAAAILAAKIPLDLYQDGQRYFYSNKTLDTTGTRYPYVDDDIRVWLHQSLYLGLYADLALFGATPNAGTTTPATGGANGSTGTTGSGNAGTTGGTSGSTTTPPASSGIPLADFYPNGTPLSLTVADRRTKAKAEYDKFKTQTFVDYYCDPSGANHTPMPTGMWRVAVPDEVNDDPYKTVSEGIGYGMLLTAIYGNPNLPTNLRDANAQTLFNGFWAYYKSHKDVNGLADWKQRSKGETVGTGGATDGDEDSAFGLVLAHRTWGSGGAVNYGAEATTLINAIMTKEFTPIGSATPNLMTNGDLWGFDNPTYFPDYFRPAWYREFYKHTGNSRWLDIINTNYPIAMGSFYQTYATGLIKDIKRDYSNASTPIFSYNNIRYPFALAADFLWNGANTNALAHDMPAKMVATAKVKYGTDPVAPPTPLATSPLNPYSGTSGIVAEPAVDYSYWNGNYRNASYVQAFGVAGIVDAAHTAWATACFNWLAADNEQNYFGRSLSAVSMALMAGLFQPGTPTSTGTTTENSAGTVVVPPTTTTTTPPTGALALYAEKDGGMVWTWAQGLPAGTTKRQRADWMAAIPQAWWSGIEWDLQCAGMKAYIDKAAAAGQVGQVLAYSIPGRDLGQYSQGGADNRAAYETWIGYFCAAIGTRKVIVAYEPDSLTHADELAEDSKQGRFSIMAWAIQQIKQKCPNAFLYVDTGHAEWKSVDDAARLLQAVHIENASGFAINISNFVNEATTIAYGQNIRAKLNLPNVHFVFDSGRNGNSKSPSQWANPPRRRFGRLPQFGNTQIDGCDGYLWWKRPGESDGNSGDGAPNAGGWWPTYVFNDSKGDNVDSDLVSTSSGLLQRSPAPGVAAAATY